jgi:hypothetical protein
MWKGITTILLALPAFAASRQRMEARSWRDDTGPIIIRLRSISSACARSGIQQIAGQVGACISAACSSIASLRPYTSRWKRTLPSSCAQAVK